MKKYKNKSSVYHFKLMFCQMKADTQGAESHTVLAHLPKSHYSVSQTWLRAVALIYDLHSHSSFSDGTLSPSELIARALAMGVNTLAITDHDTVDGLAALSSDQSSIAPP